ncbi:MAG: ATP-dependent DNA helicase RecG [Kofleriaceae bacterium]|nr:ATP-dependent DNA helicase RecG [Kofleriaceae bacterium]
MARVDPLRDLRDRIALAAQDNFAGVAKIGGLGGALRIAADGVLAIATGAGLAALQAWRDDMQAFEASSLAQREILVARGMRVVRSLGPIVVVPPARPALVRSQSGPLRSDAIASASANPSEPALGEPDAAMLRTQLPKQPRKPRVINPVAGLVAPVDPLAAPTSSVRGIGPAFAQSLAEGGVHTVEDLLWLVPVRYDDARRARPISSLDVDRDDGQRVVLTGEVASARMVFARGRRWADVKLVDIDGASIQIRFFNAWAGIEKKFPVGNSVCVAGVVRYRAGRPELANPDVLTTDGTPIVTYYPRIAGVPPARIKSACLAALAHVTTLADEIPPSVAAQLHLPSLVESVQTLHQPPATLTLAQVDDMLAGVSPWHQRLAFGELFALATAAAMQRAARCAGTALACPAVPALQASVAAVLGFELTGAQQAALTQIAEDLQRPVPMNRLLEGDVGSGKTAVAFGAALAAVRAGYQVAVMAPTEVLAEQHDKNLRRWGASLGVRVVLLTASTPSGIRNSTLSLAAAGAVDIVIGTHALLAERVGFANLALVIIDEQQRFGVAQRMKLRDKGGTGVGVPHLLVMTATPIPRTLALTAFGDLDRTVLNELPPGRTPIATRVVSGKAGWKQAVAHMRATLADGHQVYVVCPRIAADADAGPALEGAQRRPSGTEIDAESVHQRLIAELTEVEVGLVHGRQASPIRDATMRGFRDGSVAVLVATTVIEVGVDNPNASLMMILGADRFGLSQLHQLRGRVGRGAAQSSCWLHANADPTPEGKQRLAAMMETTDGFKIAERDLQLRGPGELFGEQQAGAPRLAIGDQALYIELLVQARAHAGPLVAADPALTAPVHALLRAAVQRRIGSVFDAQSG